LGLSIVKIILDAHGSAVAVESEEGRGTEFRFELPVLERAAAQAEAARDGSEGLVLVVDDEPELVAAVRRDLDPAGFSVLGASTAAEGWSLARKRRPDAIILDVLLPDRSGLDLLRSLKQEPELRNIPVLVISIVESGVKAISLGAAEYLPKPLERAAVLATVRRLVDGVGGREPVVLVADDEADTADLIRDTLKAEGFRVLVARDGRQALEIMSRRRPDLLLLDLMMPRLSGFEVLEAMRRDAALAQVPVVILSARGDEADAQRSLDLGARRYLHKPFDMQALIAEIRQQVGGRAEGEGHASL
jgi:DNA-binding response OmpR family regulator